MAQDRMTGIGLGIAGLGWAALVADVAFSPFLVNTGNLAAVASLRADVFSIAETTILSGFALALLGSLRAGFGALARFFDAVLDRAATPRPAVPTVTPLREPPPVSLDAEPIEPVMPTPSRPAPQRGRNYTILANGAVEVDTLLGTRVFASFDEARDYIR